MKRKQLKSQLEQILREFVHFKTVPFGYKSGKGKLHMENNYTNIYMGFTPKNIQNIGWVSENIRGTAYVRNLFYCLPNTKSKQERDAIWDKAQQVILDYANTPLNKRQDKYVVAVGRNYDGTLAVYSKDACHIVNVPRRAVKKYDCFQFSDREFHKLCGRLPGQFEDIAKSGKLELSAI